MKTIVYVLLPVSVLLSCTKEAVLPNVSSTILTVKSQPTWNTTALDDLYIIQFPSNCKGGIGPTIEGPEFSVTSKDNSVYLLDPLPTFRGRTLLTSPAPEQIIVIRDVLDQVVTFQRNGQTQGVFYYAKRPKIEGRLFLLRNNQLSSSLVVQCNADSFQEVLGILQTIQPK